VRAGGKEQRGMDSMALAVATTNPLRHHTESTIGVAGAGVTPVYITRLGG
jgi:hypothetical protein